VRVDDYLLYYREDNTFKCEEYSAYGKMQRFMRDFELGLQ